MKPLYLYLEDFMAFSKSELYLADLSSVLVVGKMNDNDLYANGVGKSSLFKALEYVFFNEAYAFNLEKIIRDDALKCKVICDFSIENKIYRISRSRSKKGASDLSLYERTTIELDGVNPHSSELLDDQFKQLWSDISSRRASDTEEDLHKLIKADYKQFSAAHHFVQHDFGGLAKATASERKKFFKQVLHLAIYSKLEKLAKEKGNFLCKEIQSKSNACNLLGNPLQDISVLVDKKVKLLSSLEEKQAKLLQQQQLLENDNNQLANFKNKTSTNLTQTHHLTHKKTAKNNELNKINIEIDNFSIKKKNLVNEAKIITNQLKELIVEKDRLVTQDFKKIDIIKANLIELRDKISQNLGLIKSELIQLEDLEIPLPSDNLCKHCRQYLSPDHREECQKSIDKEIAQKQSKITFLQQENQQANTVNKNLVKQLEILEKDYKLYNNILSQISLKEKDVAHRKNIFEEYTFILAKYKVEQQDLIKELDQINQELLQYQQDINLEIEIDKIKNSIIIIKNTISNLEKEIVNFNAEITITQHQLSNKEKDLNSKNQLTAELNSLTDEYKVILDVIASFGPTGIPNLIIQNVLDDLQIEANNILNQIKPGLQLAFSIIKTNNDGEEGDDLDITYLYNNKSRDYGQLSGAMHIAIMFSLKLGLASLLKKNLGVDITLLLIDETDQGFDKASTDAFADMIKHFSKEFTIFVITHNDRLKDKFSQAILVEQDQNMISTAKVISW